MQDNYSTGEYLTVPDTVNILDQRHIGFGKTTEGLQLIDHNVRHGKVSIVVMRSYDNLREMYGRLSPDTRARSVLFQGRPQPGMCNFTDEIETFKNIIPSLISCGSCGENYCGYQAQKQRIRDLKADSTTDQGLVIFTVRDNLHTVIWEFFRSKWLTIIVDDIPLSDILWPGYQTTKEEIEKAIEFFVDMNPVYVSLLVKVSEMLITESPKTTLQFIKENEIEIQYQIKELGRSIHDYYEMFGTQGVPSFNYLSHLMRASNIRINDPIKPSIIIIYNSQVERIKGCRTIYINGTPTANDRKMMDRLGPYQPLTEQAPNNDNFIVLQYRKAKYTQQSLKDSPVLPPLLEKLVGRVKHALEFIDTPLLFMTDGKAYEKKYREILTDRLSNHEFVPFFSRNANSTNQYRNAPILILFGTPTKPPEAYIGPSYDSVRIDTDQLSEAIRASKEKKAKTGRPDAVYPVPPEIVTDDIRGQVIQMTGRTHRKGDRTDAPKLVVLLNMVDTCDESGYIAHTGARVYTVDNETEFVKLYGKMAKLVLEPRIMDRVYQEIDHQLQSGIRPGLIDTSATYSQKVAGIVSKRTIEKLLRERYSLEDTLTQQGRNKIAITGIKPKMDWANKNRPEFLSNHGLGAIGFEFHCLSLYNTRSPLDLETSRALSIWEMMGKYVTIPLTRPKMKVLKISQQ